MHQQNQVSTFKGNETCEVFIALHSKPELNFESEVTGLIRRYENLLKKNECNIHTEVFLRIHLSDVTNQAPILREHLSQRNSFISVVGQPPAYSSRIAIVAYHIQSTKPYITKKIKQSPKFYEAEIELSNYTLVYQSKNSTVGKNSYEQTREQCQEINNAITKNKGTLKNNCLRTWFFCRDIDNNYAGLVEARREFFKSIGLTPETGYVASTGIDGKSEDPHRYVKLDSLSAFHLRQEQLKPMEALGHMPPTHVYNVTFERGTQVVFGDRSHYYISGTASIDAKGKVVHVGDVRKQTQRMIRNVDALLKNNGGKLTDLKIANIYLRDSSDTEVVENELNKLLPASLPRIIVVAPVCRPEWLVELDAIAINSNSDSKFKNFE